MENLMPQKGRSEKEILAELKELTLKDPDYKNARLWSLVYYLDEHHSSFINSAYNMYASANGLNPTEFKSLKTLENRIIRTAAQLFNGDKNVCGVVTSGGTESCLLAVKTYRDYAKDKKNIRKPEMILPETAHVAWLKGAEYFGVKPVFVKLDKSYKADVNEIKKKINRNTVMLLASAPEYPHGIIDPVMEIGSLGEKNGIPVHVDACVGGFILPFIEKTGKKLPVWDYRVPGVTSISADIHKYGFAAKGASTITYRNLDYLKYQMFVHQDWPGGVFASPALLGTRPGGAYAAAWAVLQKFGMEGYIQLAEQVIKNSENIIRGISEIPELEIIGEPAGPILSYKSVDPYVNIFAVGDQMEKSGWHIDRLQMPDALHAMITPIHKKAIKHYLEDLKKAVKTVKEHPELAESGSAATYGMIAHVPFRKMVKKQVLDLFASMYGPDGGEIDLSDPSFSADAISSADGTERSGTGKKAGLLEKIIQKYVSRQIKKGK